MGLTPEQWEEYRRLDPVGWERELAEARAFAIGAGLLTLALIVAAVVVLARS